MAFKTPGAGSSVGPFAVQVGLDPRSYDRSIKFLDKYKGAELAKREEVAIQKTANLALPAIKAQTPRGATGELLAKTKVRRLRTRSGEKAAWAAGSTSHVRHLVIDGHKVVGHRPNRTYLGKHTEPNPYVSRAIDPIESELESFISEQVERIA